VTIGILIALSLEETLQTVHDRHLVSETRENFRVELSNDAREDDDEFPRVTKSDQALKQLVADLPMLARDHPDQIALRLKAVDNPGYFLTQNSWQAALSTGALAHMPTEELQEYAATFEGIRLYTGYQAQRVHAEDSTKAFFAAHPKPTPAEVSEGVERIMLLARAEQTLDHVGEQLHDALLKTLGKK
jgi:hypothetical protein